MKNMYTEFQLEILITSKITIIYIYMKYKMADRCKMKRFQTYVYRNFFSNYSVYITN